MTLPEPAAWIGVPESFAISMPRWKWAHEPSGGSSPNPVQPNGWVTTPGIGHMRLPEYCDGMPPLWSAWRTSLLIRPSSACSDLICDDRIDLALALFETSLA